MEGVGCGGSGDDAICGGLPSMVFVAGGELAVERRCSWLDEDEQPIAVAANASTSHFIRGMFKFTIRGKAIEAPASLAIDLVDRGIHRFRGQVLICGVRMSTSAGVQSKRAKAALRGSRNFRVGSRQNRCNNRRPRDRSRNTGRHHREHHTAHRDGDLCSMCKIAGAMAFDRGCQPRMVRWVPERIPQDAGPMHCSDRRAPGSQPSGRLT